MIFQADHSGTKQIQKQLQALGRVPQRCVNVAAGKGATAVRKALRGTVPEGETGNLKKAIIRVRERSRVQGKRGYQITFDRSFNDVLQKPIKRRGLYGGKSAHAYYPASQNYGFLHAGRIGYVPGYHFMEAAMEEAAPAALQIMRQTFHQELEKELEKQYAAK